MDRKKLTTRQESELEQQTLQGQQTQQGEALEFNTPEEMLRHDALHTPVPPGIGLRLKDSLEGLPKPQRGWWRKLFGR